MPVYVIITTVLIEGGRNWIARGFHVHSLHVSVHYTVVYGGDIVRSLVCVVNGYDVIVATIELVIEHRSLANSNRHAIYSSVLDLTPDFFRVIRSIVQMRLTLAMLHDVCLESIREPQSSGALVQIASSISFV